MIRDGIVHWSEIQMQPDMVVLAAPEIAGLPYVVSGLIAAGALAAALSTADGLLLTIANALSHDVYYCMVAPDASSQRRVTISKVLLLGVALFASYVASLNTGKILFSSAPRSRWRPRASFRCSCSACSGSARRRVARSRDGDRARGVRVLHRVDSIRTSRS